MKKQALENPNLIILLPQRNTNMQHPIINNVCHPCKADLGRDTHGEARKSN